MPEKILIVDDDPDSTRLAQVYLSGKRYQIVVARDGVEGLELAEIEEPDLILLDIMMPRMDGHQTLRELRRRPHLSYIPVIMLTARGEVEDRVHGLELGADDYLAKPYNPQELFARVKAVLRRSLHRTQNNRENYNLIKSLAERYERRRYLAYSRHLVTYPDLPPGWKAPSPDLYVEKGNEKIALVAEFIESLLDERTSGRWKALASIPGLQLRVLVRSKRAFKIAKLLCKEHGIHAKVVQMLKAHLLPRRRLLYINLRELKALTLLIIAICIGLALLISSPTYQKFIAKLLGYKGEYYEPKDVERQIYMLEKEKKDIERQLQEKKK